MRVAKSMFQTNKVQAIAEVTAGALMRRDMFKFLFMRIKLFTVNSYFMLTLCIINFLEI